MTSPSPDPGAGEQKKNKVIPIVVANAPRRKPKAIAHAGGEPDAFYAPHQKIYPRMVSGVFAHWRSVMVLLTLGVFYLLPWINWGAGRQAFLIDLPGRKFNLFWWTFWPQDLFYLTAILIISALSLFLFTAVAGRLWCGYTCPQTVWTEAFVWMERLIEGDRMKQMRLADAPWNVGKIGKRAAKYGLWFVFALWTGFTFVGFFTPIRELFGNVVQWSVGPWEGFWILFYALATFGNAGFLREQVCIYMCPYGRFQSVMFDQDTLIVAYDAARGEPRGARSKKADYKAQGLGDCIECTQCVQVCPTGIDIRDGLQYECIACAACIDVCDDVMDKMGYPRGLIRYTTQNALEGKLSGVTRPRILIYGAILVGICVALVISVLLRVPLALDVLRDRSALYRETADGDIENVYTLKVMNMDRVAHAYSLEVSGVPGLRPHYDPAELTIRPGEVREAVVRLVAPAGTLAGRASKVEFSLVATDKPSIVIREKSRFLGPRMEGL